MDNRGTEGVSELYPRVMAAGHRGNVKGSVILSRLGFARAQGEAAFQRILAALPAADREALSAIVLASGWYPFELNEQLDLSIAAVVGGGDELFRELGRQSARDNLASVHRGFVRNRDPHGVLRDSTALFKLYYDTGTRRYERLGATRALLQTCDSLSFSSADCCTVMGFFEQAIVMCGGEHVRVVDRQCRSKGAEVCEYHFEWTEEPPKA